MSLKSTLTLNLLLTCRIFNLLFLYSLNQKLNLAQQQMTADYSKLKKEEEEKSVKLLELTYVFIFLTKHFIF